MTRRWPRRLWRFTKILLLLIFGAGLFVYFNLRDVVVWFANRGDPQLVLDVGSVSPGWNSLKLSDVVLKLRGTNEQIVRVDSAVIDFSWHDLSEHRIRAVTIGKPHIRITDRVLENARNNTTVTEPILPESIPWLIQKFKVTEGEGEVDLSGLPLVRFSIAPEFNDLQLSANARKATAQQTISLEDIKILSRGDKSDEVGRIGRVELKFSQEEALNLNFDELTIRGPSFQITPEAMKTAGGTAPPPVQVSNRPQTNPQATSFPNLRIGKLKIEDGEVFIKGFGETIPEGSLKFGMTTDDLEFGESGAALEKKHALQVWDVRLAPTFAPLAPFALIDSFQIEFTPAGLLQRKEIAGATLTGMTITMGQEFRSFMNAGGKSATSPPPAATPPPSHAANASAPATKPWKLRELNLVNSRITFTDLGVGTTSISFNLETTLKDVPLSLALTDAADEVQEQEISDFAITSPLDSFAPVLTVKTIFIRYSIAGLLRHEIEDIQILNPTIYVGEDLFWYFDELGKREAQAPAPNPAPATGETGWRLKKIGIAYGQLVIASGGQGRLPLPLQFSSTAENLNLGRLSDLKLALDLKVPQEDYIFPGYKLELRQLGGTIRFDLPPQSGQNNLVQTLKMKEIRWRQFRAEEGWLAVTFDGKGINGQIGAKGYGGYVNGGFTSFFGETSPWVGWLSGAKVDLKKVTDVMVPGNFTMDGPADFKLEAAGSSSHLERIRGNVRTVRNGKMRVGKLDQLVADIPTDWYWLKKEGTRILLETLRDFSYDTGDVSFWYLNDEGNLKFTLRGPTGSRNIDVVLHGAEDRNR